MATATILRAVPLLAAWLPFGGCGGDVARGTTGTTRGTGDAGGRDDTGDARDVTTMGDAGDAGGECAFTACGGDPVGTWTIQRICPASLTVPNCPVATLGPKNVTASGSFTFGADGTLSVNVTSTGTYEAAVPASCVLGSDCASIALSLTQMNAPLATCSDDGTGGCTCSSPVTPTQTGSGPYTIVGSTAGNMYFCVENDSLKLRNAAGTVFVSVR